MLCNYIYDIVIDANLTESQRVDFFNTISKYIIHLADGFEMRRCIIKYKLKDFYYGPGKLQEKLENEWLLWRTIWDIIYRDAYTEKEMNKSVAFFKVHIDDALFIMNNVYHKDIKTIQDLNYNPRIDYELYDPAKLIRDMRPKLIRMIKRKMRFLFDYDPGSSLADFIAEAEFHALKGYRKYDGKCSSELDAQRKMFNCARSWVMDTLNDPKTHESKRVVCTTCGYERSVLSLDAAMEETDTLISHIPCNESLIELELQEFMFAIEKRCSSGVVAYIKDVVLGQSDLPKSTPNFYFCLRQKHGITKKQVRQELSYILNK